MQFYQNQNGKTPVALLSGLKLEHSPENDEYTGAIDKNPGALRWIDETLEMFVVMFQWRTTAANLRALSALWAKNFRGWRLSPEIIDRATELAQKSWKRIPDNITQAFSELLAAAQDEAERKRREQRQGSQIALRSPDEEALRIRNECSKKIKAKHFAEKKWDMKIATECGMMLASLEKTARQEKPKASEIEVLRLVETMI